MNEVDIDTRDYLTHVVTSFSPGIRYACAYGSGVFKQSGHKSIKDNMIDFIFVVNDAFSWHYQTLQRYPNHYSFMRNLGPKYIASCQNNYGAGVYFNTCVEFEGRLIKYGVIDLNTFVKDLTDWQDLYIAGRLHKPVFTLTGLDNPVISPTFNLNLQSAVHTSLLALPETFPIEELFLSIASLSYTGDFRMMIGEDKGKVSNIVLPNMVKFEELYNSTISENNSIQLKNGTIQQDMDPFVRFSYAASIPVNLRNLMYRNLNTPRDNIELFKKKFMAIASDHKACRENVLKGVSQIVRRSSTTQTIKNSATAGFSKSIVYSAEKLRKMMRGLLK